MLELHVWGPAFFLPSIDPQCLATIAYFVQAVPKEAWVLVASSDPSLSPTNELPALKNGETWVSRFRNIVDYLWQYSNGEWGLDRSLDGLEKADKAAFSAFIEAKGQPLLDLSFYVSSQNYYGKISPAYGTILQWPNQWIIPPKLRNAAKARTEHLGLSSLDLQAIEEQRSREHSAAVAAGKIPKNLIQRPQDTVSSLLGKTPQQNKFKLDALTAEFFEPLQELLGHKTYFLSDKCPSTLDCLALGYLSLSYIPDLPYPWLRESLQTKAPRLVLYVEGMRRKCFGLVGVSDSFSPSPNTSLLPWRPPEGVTISRIGSTLVNTLADATPILRDIRMNNRLQEVAKSSDSGLSPQEKRAISSFAEARKLDTYISVATAITIVGAFFGYMFHEGLIVAKSDVDKERGGEAEVALNIEDII
ncbi:hypothetical protein Egran_03683 [Elaphomyces granulatus]|uniref:Mitochondrial outer membrane transport complex Sam37/metaxin N-terminal domain-containing protein n=1 Tax=Elaphomyces granulatus TaxID=519963 RepID=A0A232LWL7_9EURO|nr:hypothetical protein Egran_03683 [Elaphomyces granulatus]